MLEGGNIFHHFNMKFFSLELLFNAKNWLFPYNNNNNKPLSKRGMPSF